MRIRVIVNRGGGTLRAGDEAEIGDRIVKAFAAHDVEPDVRPTDPEGIAGAFADAAEADGIDAVIAAGGDGTISCAAGRLADTNRPLGILPLGTLNHFARDAGIPSALDEAVALIATGGTRRIDVGEVNGRIFVNNSSVGLYPDMVRLRDLQQERIGRSKRMAMLSASAASFRSFRRRRLWISAPGLEAPIRTPLLFVGNNIYQVKLFGLGQRTRLDAGELCLYAVRARSRAGLLWAGVRGLFGKLDQQRDFVTAYVPALEVSSDRPQLVVSIDGETARMDTPLRYRIRPGALRLIAPPAR